MEQLNSGRSLAAEEIDAAIAWLADEQVAPEPRADLLAALARKGETATELSAFVRAMRARAVAVPFVPVDHTGEVLDVCGTGGDQLGTFNISTTVALVCAAAGVTVAKHGNRAVTSQSGSADVLEALGIRIELEPTEAARWLHEHQFAFLFAPRYHPAARAIAPARKLCAARGQRTIFNLLGPLLNPARPGAQLLGVPRPELCETMARVLQTVGTHRAMVVCGEVPGGHLDELSTLGPSTIAEFHHDRGFHASVLDPTMWPLQPADLAALAGGDRHTNARIVRDVLSGQDRGPRADAVQLNAAAGLFLAGRCSSMEQGWELAARLLTDGSCLRKLEELIAASRA